MNVYDFVDIFGIHLIPNLEWDECLNYYKIHSNKKTRQTIQEYIIYYLKNNFFLPNKIIQNLERYNIFYFFKCIKINYSNSVKINKIRLFTKLNYRLQDVSYISSISYDNRLNQYFIDRTNKLIYKNYFINDTFKIINMSLINPFGICISKDNKFYISDDKTIKIFILKNNRLKIFNNLNLEINNFRPLGIALNRKEDKLYIADQNNHNIVILDLLTLKKDIILSEGNGNYELKYPCDVKIDHKDNIVIADSGNNRIKILSKNHRFIMNIGHADEIFLYTPSSIDIDYNNNIIIKNKNKIIILNKTNIIKEINLNNIDDYWGGLLHFGNKIININNKNKTINYIRF